MLQIGLWYWGIWWIWAVFWLAWVIIDIIIAIWIYNDAQAKNNENAVLWAVIGLLLGIIGLIIYLVIGREKK